MNPEQFRQELLKNDIDLSDKQMIQFATYFNFLVIENKKMNLTAITEETQVYLKHFYDSITLGFEYTDLLKEDISVCDVGSGAGFPIIPLKIVNPKLKITIIDSLGKRINFLNELAEKLDLQEFDFVHMRAEDAGRDSKYRAQFDLVTARAVAKLNVLSEFCLPLTKIDGEFLAMKTESAEQEVDDAKKAIAVLGGKLIGTKEFVLSADAGKRVIVEIQKKKVTPNQYPRKAGTPSKKPIH
ncbi:ribosomal RNA small subunit methyltransferase G [Companilactobacillus sp. RD055328]|uniref:16S rRNA (guanine(527)-N(7))-methyltransferase RsmG n=1 Tax=Companilactobacillus sp. RD055328 TaxID=2916634 RepID=UPI001FC7F4C2|nr:16S rRNA (guanine(527)-N(7))-methyltransferase RsmG [Companilactobacillus sp. RD055328]GKQ43459.1 ribosomal RNA small subunit methyltransferase G [Companilactobacillus sp. RD055328]